VNEYVPGVNWMGSTLLVNDKPIYCPLYTAGDHSGVKCKY
jgi:hypothetical protein